MMEEIMNNAIGAAILLAPIIAIAIQVVKQLEVVNVKYLPLLSIVIGMLTGAILSSVFNQNIAIYTLAGFLSGASASGLYEGIKNSFALAKGDK
ncbi:holin [Carnobacterium antarcticum]|uniref:Holin n=1 Tax=Carnobacterium antarcticum TaxID=2126436 RepID=A0ABW4NNH0_9LACT|nr:holin [Carnobacterium sp. CP1]ALV20774.1 hypothetical protein NY10_149 [Carnobacterium sp. CP1]